MAKIYGQLEQAQLQNNAGNLSGNIVGRVFYDTTALKAKFQTASLSSALLANDQNCVFGTNGTANSNVRLNRAAVGVLQLVLGGDSTAEGSFSANFAQLSFKIEQYATGSLPAAGSEGRLLYDSTLHKAIVDNGSSLLTLGTLTGTETFTNKTLTSPAINGANFNYGTASNTNRLLLPTDTSTNLAGYTNTAGLIAYDSTLGKPVFNSGAGFVAIGSVSVTLVTQSKTTTYTALVSDDVILASTAGGLWTLTLPTPVGISGKLFKIKKTTADFIVLTISTPAGNLVGTNGSASTTTLNTIGEYIEIVSDGTNWNITQRVIPSVPTLYTLVLTGTGGTGPTPGTIVHNLASYQRIGNTIYVQIRYDTSSTGTNGSGSTLFSIPPLLVVDTTKTVVVGDVSNHISGSVFKDSYVNSGVCFLFDTTHVGAASSATGTISSGNANSLGVSGGTDWDLAFTVPIVGWNN
jgi:hypothetical protein